MFQNASGQTILILYSDKRQQTGTLDLAATLICTHVSGNKRT